MQVDFRLQAFRAMRKSVSVITIQNFFFRDLSELQETRRHQLSRRVERNVSFDRSPLPSEQLIIKNFTEK